jgi:hypothetical protein
MEEEGDDWGKGGWRWRGFTGRSGGGHAPQIKTPLIQICEMRDPIRGVERRSENGKRRRGGGLMEGVGVGGGG